MTDDVTSISGDGLSAGIAALGAELQFLRDADGRDLLWDGDPAVWSGRAPLLFPIVGALRDDRYRLDGSSFSMPKHGFARRSRFTPVERADDAVTFRLEASEETRAAYPFEFRLDVRYAVRGATLSIDATIRNRGEAPMPASFGFHPALRWPLPYGRPRDAHRLRFDRPETAPIRRIDATGLLTPVRHPTPIEGDVLPLRDDLFADDAIILDRPAAASVAYGAPDGPQVDVRYPGMPMLGLWTKPGADYICIEPWAGIADPEGFEGDLFAKPAIMVIPPGGSERCGMSIGLRADG